MKTNIKEFIKYYCQALKNNNAAVFAGAGLSKASGFVDWKELMRDIALDLGLDVDKETDMIAIAQYHINDRLGNRSIINQTIIDHFTEKVELTENHEILASLPIGTFWTTNYDTLIEDALTQAGKTADVKRISENLLITMPKSDAIIYKMHGDITIPNDAVLTKEDYETFEISRKSYSIVLQSDLLSKTFLFVGYSFDDPNLMYVLTRIKNLLGTKNIRTHYCIFKKETSKAKSHKQELRLKDLNRYGIKAILIDDFSEISEILMTLKNQFKNSSIFISGAAEEFKNEDYDKQFIHNLSKFLVSKKLKIISGFGNKVGSGIINGALDYIFSTNYRNIDEYIKLRPFPQYFFNGTKLPIADFKVLKKERNNKYRELMLSEAGIAIFIYGNKLDEKGKIVNSNGMYEEFEIASELGVKPIPVGTTGYMAEKIWSEVVGNFSKYYGNDTQIKTWLSELGDNKTTQDKIIENIYLIINKLNSI